MSPFSFSVTLLNLYCCIIRYTMKFVSKRCPIVDHSALSVVSNVSKSDCEIEPKWFFL